MKLSVNALHNNSKKKTRQWYCKLGNRFDCETVIRNK